MTAPTSDAAVAALFVDDSSDDVLYVTLALQRAGLQIDAERVETAEDLREALGRRRWDVVLCDWDIPGFGAMPALSIVRQSGLDVPVIIVSGVVGEEPAVAALRAGASDFVAKHQLTRLAPAILREQTEFQERVCRRAAEAEVIAAHAALRLAEKMRAVGDMAAGVAHDLGNVLSPLSLQLQLLQTQPLPDAAVATCAKMRTSIDRGLRMIESLRQFSRQRDDEPLVAVDLRAAVATALESVAPEYAARPDIQLQSDNAPKGRVLGHSDELVRAVANLLVNAIEAVGARGVVRLVTGGDDDAAWVEVTDDGPGMSPDLVARACEPLFTTKPTGTGMGLASAYAYAIRCRGTLRIDSTPAVGTTVRLRFPRRRDA